MIRSTSTINSKHPPFIVAEMSANHNQSLDKALLIVEAAARAGAHGLKIQTYTADTLTLNVDNPDFFINDKNSLWNGRSLYDLYQEAHTPWEWHKPIFDRCKELGIVGFSTPFDETAVDFLEDLDVPMYKVASFESNHLPLLRKIAKTGKPIMVSTGMATIDDITEIISTIREIGNNQIILLKCTSAYPALPEEANLKTIPYLRKLFDCEVGLSDHTIGTTVAVGSIAFGATVVEKHFTISRSDGGVDSAFSIEPNELSLLVRDSQIAWKALGRVSRHAFNKEEKSVIFRRSLYISKNMKRGEVFRYGDNIRIVRPGFGLAPKELDKFIGRKVKHNVKAGTRVSLDLLE
jgi:pseudaminic acid synthase